MDLSKLMFKPFVPVQPTWKHEFKPGEVIKLHNGKMYLIGDVNYNLGYCDDCVDFGIDDIKEIASIDQLTPL